MFADVDVVWGVRGLASLAVLESVVHLMLRYVYLHVVGRSNQTLVQKLEIVNLLLDTLVSSDRQIHVRMMILF